MAHRWSPTAAADMAHRWSRASTATAPSATTPTTAPTPPPPASPTSASGINDARACHQKGGGHCEYQKCILARFHDVGPPSFAALLAGSRRTSCDGDLKIVFEVVADDAVGS